LGARSAAGGTIHSVGRPSSFADSWPAATSSPRASGVTVDRSQAYGSRIMRGGSGAMRRKQRDAKAEDKKRKERL
jgi:hypothetical protein